MKLAKGMKGEDEWAVVGVSHREEESQIQRLLLIITTSDDN